MPCIVGPLPAANRRQREPAHYPPSIVVTIPLRCLCYELSEFTCNRVYNAEQNSKRTLRSREGMGVFIDVPSSCLLCWP
jgi:hypothetical protein